MDNAYVQEFDRLWATSLTPEMHERTVGYWFTVTNAAVAHTAFRTRDELDQWLTERGLTLASPLPQAGEGGDSQIIGSYRRSLDRDQDRFESLEPILVTTAWDNGERVPAKITEADGVRTVHVMNVNYRDHR
ncbi:MULTISPECIES: hypothetical protein [Mycolicibacterium]|uniref:hypothetical protein n=1 Tax=Mycolicibacterium TaxID=1866885 RepID=UPI001CDC9EF2|nr:hypothetical protein [Mycolicibacterium fortuitum]UBV20340.1 hypothetical protein H8Z59_24155 [Mycolicibacterium fortuitum]